MRRLTAANRDLTPHTMEPCQALVTLDGFVALVALGGAVPLHPEVMHDLQRGRSGRWWGGGRQVRGRIQIDRQTDQDHPAIY